MNGLTLTFHLAGINNQNFLMRDEETGTYWQQISGRAIAGPLKGQALPLIPSEELTFALWKAEQPQGIVLKEVAAYTSKYAPKDWETKVAEQYPAALNFPEHGLDSRDIMLGMEGFGEARAYRYKQVVNEKLIQDRLGSEPVILLVGPDGESVRAFHVAEDFYRTGDAGAVMMDSKTGSRWNFQGCAIDGSLKGKCLEPVRIMKDFWFDWRNYHPGTTVYSGARGKSIWWSIGGNGLALRSKRRAGQPSIQRATHGAGQRRTSNHPPRCSPVPVRTLARAVARKLEQHTPEPHRQARAGNIHKPQPAHPLRSLSLFWAPRKGNCPPVRILQSVSSSYPPYSTLTAQIKAAPLPKRPFRKFNNLRRLIRPKARTMVVSQHQRALAK